MKLLFIFLLFIIISSCKDPVHPVLISNKTDHLETQNKTNKSRDVWQRPSKVLDLLGDLEGKTVADIGAGTGFFSFRLLFRNANVIAIDINPQMLDIIESFKLNLDAEVQKKLKTRLALPNDPKIEKDEVDFILIINTIGYFDNRISYLQNLRKQLPDGGKLMIVDFKSKELPIEVPNLDLRIPLFQIEKDLKNAGFETLQSDDSTLDYQFIVIAEK